MQTSTSPRYNRPAILFHWLLAFLILVLIGIGWYMVGLPKRTPAVAQFYTLHKSLGLIAAFLIAMRVIWRVRHTPAPLPTALPQWQRSVAKISHWLLYSCMILMPVSGFTASNFRKFGVKFFGIQLPQLGWEDKGIYSFFNSVHVFTSYVLVALIVVHVLAGIKHAIERDGVFTRMLP